MKYFKRLAFPGILLLLTVIIPIAATGQDKKILKVPSDFPTLSAAVENAGEGDWIILAPGTYSESEIEIAKPLVISSEWKVSGDESLIEETVIDAGDKILFTITADGTEISGLKMINGDHTLNIHAKVTVSHNHFINNKDGISFESGGGGYAGYNTAENDRDDALDSDIVNNGNDHGSDILVEHNTFINCHDDGIEIRLFRYPEQNVNYTIRNNRIIGSTNAGIQLISYDKFTGKEFHIHHNIITHCKTGLGCMEGGKTKEDLTGATLMDETVYFYNNTLVGNSMGATGGNSIIAFNNLVSENALGGFKMFGPRSVIFQNLFFNNAGNDLSENRDASIGEGNLFSSDPVLDLNTFFLAGNSPCIDAGRSFFEKEGVEAVKISPDYIAGNAPDIGAVEYGLAPSARMKTGMPLRADAGEDRVSESARIVLAGRIQPPANPDVRFRWKQENGPDGASLEDADKLVAEAILAKEGIYTFSLLFSDGSTSASDFVTVRYINDGEGMQHFLNAESSHTLLADEFAYSYGNVSGERKSRVSLEGSESEGRAAMVEFSVGMAEEGDYNLWVLMRSLSPGKNNISVAFDGNEAGMITAPADKKSHWVHMTGSFHTSPGQWPLMIINREGKVILEKILLTTDPDYRP